MIKSIKLKYFKSYKQLDLQNINRINIFCGPNGSGKSNLSKAILFALTDQIPFNQNQKKNFLHFTNQNVQHPIQVCITLLNQQKNIPVNNFYQQQIQEVKIVRKWNLQGKQQYQLNKNVVNKSHISNYLELIKLSFNHPYNIVQQGKINSITTMKQNQLYKLLQQATGIANYIKKRDESLQHLERVMKQKQVIEQKMNNLKTIINDIGIQKQTYNQYKQSEAELRLCFFFLYKINIEQINKQINRIINELNQLKQVYKGKNQDFQNIMQKKEVLQRNIALHGKLISYIETEQIEQDLKQEIMQKQDKGKQWNKKDLNKIKTQIQMLQNKSSEIWTLICKNSKITSSKTNKNQLEKNIKQYKSLIQNINSQQLPKLQILIEQTAQRVNKSTNKYKQYKNITYQIKTLDQNKIAIIKNRIIANRKKAEIQNQITLLQKQLQATNLNINYFVNKGLQGLYGKLIDFLYIQKNICYAVQLATKNKLFTYIVDNQKTAAILSKMNKQLNGHSISIFNIEWINDLKEYDVIYPENDSVMNLTNKKFIRIELPTNKIFPEDFNSKVQKLLKYYLGRFVIVKTYEMGLVISKQYKLNCITPNNEIIYGQGFMTQIGAIKTRSDKISLYLRQKAKIEIIQSKKNQLKKCQYYLDQLQNQEFQCIRQIGRKQIILKSDQYRLSYQDYTMEMQKKKQLQMQKTALINNKKKLNELIIKGQSELKNKEKTIISNNDIEKMKKQKFSIDKQVAEYTAKLYEMQMDMQKNNIYKQTKIKQESKMTQIEINKDRQIQERKKERQILEKQYNELNIQVLKLKDSISQDKQNIYKLQAKINKMEVHKQQYQNKKKQLKLIDTFMDIQNKQQLLKKIEKLKTIQSKKYSTRDKLFLQNIDKTVKQVQQFEIKYQELRGNQQKIYWVIEKYNKDCEKIIESTFDKFEDFFQYYFRRFVPKGNAQIRLVKVSNEKKRNSFKNGLQIKISFDENKLTKWSQLSGGQKTVIALIIIFSLQKIDPSPFYFFDEIDAALDPNYRKIVSQMQIYVTRIEENSQKSQYFICTFKDEFLFDGQKTTYFHVRMQNRESQIDLVSRQQIVKLMRNFSEMSLGK